MRRRATIVPALAPTSGAQSLNLALVQVVRRVALERQGVDATREVRRPFASAARAAALRRHVRSRRRACVSLVERLGLVGKALRANGVLTERCPSSWFLLVAALLDCDFVRARNFHAAMRGEEPRTCRHEQAVAGDRCGESAGFDSIPSHP